MRLAWGQLCSTAEFHENSGAWTLHDVASGFGVGANGMVEFGETAQLALLFHAHANEPDDQNCRFNLTDSSGKSYSDPAGDVVHFVTIAEGLPRVGPKRITLTPKWDEVPGNVGDLTFNIFDETGQRLGRIPLTVFPAGSFVPSVVEASSGKKIPKHPFRLLWAHLADRAEVDPETHSLTLHHVFDSVPLPPSLDFLILPTLVLALQITASPAVGSDHTLTIRVVDHDGKIVSEGGRQVRFFQPKAGAQLLCSEVFNMDDAFALGHGGNVFQIRVDDEKVGEVTLQIYSPFSTEDGSSGNEKAVGGRLQ